MVFIFYVCIHISIDTVGIAGWAIASLLYSHRDGTVMENSNDLRENLVSLIVVVREYTEGAL